MDDKHVRMAPLWSWSEGAQPRSGKDEALTGTEDREQGGEARKKFVPFNRFSSYQEEK